MKGILLFDMKAQSAWQSRSSTGSLEKHRCCEERTPSVSWMEFVGQATQEPAAAQTDMPHRATKYQGWAGQGVQWALSLLIEFRDTPSSHFRSTAPNTGQLTPLQETMLFVFVFLMSPTSTGFFLEEKSRGMLQRQPYYCCYWFSQRCSVQSDVVRGWCSSMAHQFQNNVQQPHVPLWQEAVAWQPILFTNSG